MPFSQSYSNVFGGNNVNTAFPSYISYDLTSSIGLNWATSFVDNSNVLALINDFTSTAITTALGNNPLTSANGSGVVTVTVVSTSGLVTGQLITISGATDFNNLTAVQLNITATITVTSTTTFTYVTVGNANNNTSGGGNIVNLTTSNYVVTLPDSTLISTGQDIRINNVGAYNITFHDNASNFLFTIQPTQILDIYLSDNTTAAGVWRITTFGAGTSQAQASNLVGNPSGTIALNGVINTNMPNKSLNSNYTALPGDRANLIIWTGGSGTITLPTLASVGNGYFLSFNNRGGGVLTINTTDASTIDGNPTFTLNPGNSVTVDAGNPGDLVWNTLGFGQSANFQIGALTVNVAGNTDVTLTTQQAANQILQFNGVLTGNINVIFPVPAGQWYVFNNTTGNFTLTAKLTGALTGTIVPQGEKVILYSDGASLFNTPTVATSVIFSDGNAGNPSISFATDLTSGFYKVANGSMGYSSLGTQSLIFSSYGLGLPSQGTTRYYNAGNTFYAALKAGAMAANVTWTLPLIDSVSSGGILQSNAAGTLSFSTATYPSTTNINRLLFSSADNVVNQIATANNGTLITSAGGVPSISSTLPNDVQANITTLGTIATGVWNGTIITVPFGGTGLATLTTAYGVVCAGTTATGVLQNAGAGTANQVFTSNGAAALPSWKSINTALPAATKADQQTGTSTAVYANPNVQQYHKSSNSFRCTFDGTLVGTNAPLEGYNVTSVTTLGAGNFQLNLAITMSTINFTVVATGSANSGTPVIIIANTKTTTTVQIVSYSVAGTASNPATINVIGCGVIA